MQVARCVFGNCKTVALQCTVPAAENGRRIYVQVLLEAALSRRPPLPEIVLWIAASRSPSESQTSECSDLLSRSRVTFVIVTQRQPGKLPSIVHAMQNGHSPEPRAGSRTLVVRHPGARWLPLNVFQDLAVANGHTASNTPDPIRTRTLTFARPG